MSSLVRLTWEDGAVETYGPMATHNAHRLAGVANRLAEIPDCKIRRAVVLRHRGGAHDLSHTLAMAGTDVLGIGWNRRLPDIGSLHAAQYPGERLGRWY